MQPILTEREIHEALQDAGCPDELVRQYMELTQKRRMRECFRLLEHYRQEVLDGIHVEEKKIYRLDYLRHQLRKELEGGKSK